MLEIAHKLYGKVGGEQESLDELFEESFKKLDKNGDGKISYDEFEEWFTVAALKKGILK